MKLFFRKYVLLLLLYFLFSLFIIGLGYSEELKLECFLDENNNVLIKWNITKEKNIKEIKILRSTSEDAYFSNFDYPGTLIDLTKEKNKNFYIDKFTADNSEYYYELILSGSDYIKHSKKIKIKKKNIALPLKIVNPSIYIDKHNLILELRSALKVLKKYPVALGYSTKRKLFQDFKSTPEGIYKIINKQPKASYYKAYDINYPNEADKLRYNFAKSKKLIPYENGKIVPIGGEIQVHGGGIGFNWTHGCVAMRNNDIDELFKCNEINIGTKIYISGWELEREDIDSILKKRTKVEIKTIQLKLKNKGYYYGKMDGNININLFKALFQYQLSQNLPVTGELDRKTISKLGI